MGNCLFVFFLHWADVKEIAIQQDRPWAYSMNLYIVTFCVCFFL